MNENVLCIPGDTGRKTCHISTFLTTNPIWNDSELKTGACGERSANNRLSHGTALVIFCFSNCMLSEFAVSLYSPRKTVSY
jgi:hypothetical protein